MEHNYPAIDKRLVKISTRAFRDVQTVAGSKLHFCAATTAFSSFDTERVKRIVTGRGARAARSIEIGLIGTDPARLSQRFEMPAREQTEIGGKPHGANVIPHHRGISNSTRRAIMNSASAEVCQLSMLKHTCRDPFR